MLSIVTETQRGGSDYFTFSITSRVVYLRAPNLHAKVFIKFYSLLITTGWILHDVIILRS